MGGREGAEAYVWDATMSRSTAQAHPPECGSGGGESPIGHPVPITSISGGATHGHSQRDTGSELQGTNLRSYGMILTNL